MKKLVTTNGGHPLKLDDINLLQDANIEGVRGILEGLCLGYSATGVVLNGADFGTSGPNLTCTAGNIYWNGEVYPVDAQSTPLTMSPGFTRYWQIQQQVLLPSPSTYQDTTVHNVHIKERAVLVAAASLPAKSFTVVNTLRIQQILGSPKHSIMPYYGPTTHFNGVGDGIYGTPAFGYALCDGGTSTLATGGTFTRPNFMGKVLVGHNPSDTDFDSLDGSNIPNQTGGEKTHTLTKAETPKHTHQYSDTRGAITTNSSNLSGASYPLVLTYNNTDDTETTEDGTVSGLGGQPHNNLQPYHTVQWMIKLY